MQRAKGAELLTPDPWPLVSSCTPLPSDRPRLRPPIPLPSCRRSGRRAHLLCPSTSPRYRAAFFTSCPRPSAALSPSSCAAAPTWPRPCCCRRWNHQGHRKPSRLPYLSSRDRDRPCGQVRRSATRPLFPCLALGASSPSSEFACLASSLLTPCFSFLTSHVPSPHSLTGAPTLMP